MPPLPLSPVQLAACVSSAHTLALKQVSQAGAARLHAEELAQVAARRREGQPPSRCVLCLQGCGSLSHSEDACGPLVLDTSPPSVTAPEGVTGTEGE